MTNNYFSQFNDGTNLYYARAKAPGESSSLSKGRDNALVATTSLNTYSPILSMKTTNGSWELGANSTDTDNLIFSYISDTNYSAETDTAGTQLKLTNDGALTIDASIHINSNTRALYMLDDTDTEFALVTHNGTNVWLGAWAGASHHHTGRTFISTGYDTTNSIGYPTVSISVPNATNNGATTYGAFHTGYLDVSKATEGTLPVARGGTGQTSVANIQAGKDGSGNTITSTYLKLSGGTMTGNLCFQSSSCAAFSSSPTYLLGIEAFADGGTVKYKQASSVTVGSATKDGDGNTITSTYVKKAGDTMTGDLTVKKSSGSVIRSEVTSATGGPIVSVKTPEITVGLLVGTSTTATAADRNHGIYEWTSGATGWLISRPGTTNAIQTSFHAPLTGFYIRNISYGTAAASGGSNGDIYLQYFN